MKYDLCVVGGAGHVGLPLALAFASSGLRVLIHDRNESALAQIRRGVMPFSEDDGEPLLRDVLEQRRLETTSATADLADAKAIIVTIGTPVDEFLNPELDVFQQWVEETL